MNDLPSFELCFSWCPVAGCASLCGPGPASTDRQDVDGPEGGENARAFSRPRASENLYVPVTRKGNPKCGTEHRG